MEKVTLFKTSGGKICETEHEANLEELYEGAEEIIDNEMAHGEICCSTRELAEKLHQYFKGNYDS